MGNFSDDDRNMLIETHTLVKGIGTTLNDHEDRIRKNESILTKALALAGIGSLFIAGIIQSWVTKMIQ